MPAEFAFFVSDICNMLDTAAYQDAIPFHVLSRFAYASTMCGLVLRKPGALASFRGTALIIRGSRMLLGWVCLECFLKFS